MPLPSVKNWRHLITIGNFKAGCGRSSAYDQLRKATRRSIVEDLLGYGLPPEFAPGR